jgi:hypothetical protein
MRYNGITAVSAPPPERDRACVIMSLRASHALHSTLFKARILYKPELYDIVTPASFRGDAEWYRGRARGCASEVLDGLACRGHCEDVLAFLSN